MSFAQFTKTNRGEYSHNAQQSKQYGQTVITLQCSVDDVLKVFEIDPNIQRDTIAEHLADLQNYIMSVFDGHNIYFPPLIISARNKATFDEINQKYIIPTSSKLAVVDGQHRIKAFQKVIEQLQLWERHEDVQFIKDYPLSLQIFQDLTKKQGEKTYSIQNENNLYEYEQQLFVDINSKRKSVNHTKQLETKGKILHDIIDGLKNATPHDFELEKSSTYTKMMTLATLQNIMVTLNEGIMHTAMKDPTFTHKTREEYRQNTIEFIDALCEHVHYRYYNQTNYLLYRKRTLSCIAYTVHHLRIKHPNASITSIIETIVKPLDWAKTAPHWGNAGLVMVNNAYTVSNVQDTKPLHKYLNQNYETRQQGGDVHE